MKLTTVMQQAYIVLLINLLIRNVVLRIENLTNRVWLISNYCSHKNREQKVINKNGRETERFQHTHTQYRFVTCARGTLQYLICAEGLQHIELIKLPFL